MYEITGLNRKTLRTDLIAIANTYDEARRIVDSETSADDYFTVNIKKLRFAA
jgi:hypothetical protein